MVVVEGRCAVSTLINCWLTRHPPPPVPPSISLRTNGPGPLDYTDDWAWVCKSGPGQGIQGYRSPGGRNVRGICCCCGRRDPRPLFPLRFPSGRTAPAHWITRTTGPGCARAAPARGSKGIVLQVGATCVGFAVAAAGGTPAPCSPFDFPQDERPRPGARTFATAQVFVRTAGAHRARASIAEAGATCG